MTLGRGAASLASSSSTIRIQRSNGGAQTSTSELEPGSLPGGTGDTLASTLILGSINHLTHKMETSRRRLQENDLPLIVYYFSASRATQIARGALDQTLSRTGNSFPNRQANHNSPVSALDFRPNRSSIEVSPPIQFRIEWAGSQGMSPLLGRWPI
jgi:hypothetical protein